MSPKVSEDYLEARREQILDAARDCFTGKGYHGTTVQDICKAAELSPGAVYRYFDSKESIFGGLAERRVAAHAEALGCMSGLENLFESVAAVAAPVMTSGTSPGAPRPGIMELELVGEAMNNERIAEIVRRMLSGVRTNLTALVEKLQAKDRLDPGLDSKAVASVLMALFQGALFQSAIGLDFDHHAYLEVVRLLQLPAAAQEGKTA